VLKRVNHTGIGHDCIFAVVLHRSGFVFGKVPVLMQPFDQPLISGGVQTQEGAMVASCAMLARIDTRRDNTSATAFDRRLGMTETHRTDHDIFFTYPLARFMADRDGYFEFLKQAGQP